MQCIIGCGEIVHPAAGEDTRYADGELRGLLESDAQVDDVRGKLKHEPCDERGRHADDPQEPDVHEERDARVTTATQDSHHDVHVENLRHHHHGKAANEKRHHAPHLVTHLEEGGYPRRNGGEYHQAEHGRRYGENLDQAGADVLCRGNACVDAPAELGVCRALGVSRALSDHVAEEDRACLRASDEHHQKQSPDGVCNRIGGEVARTHSGKHHRVHGEAEGPEDLVEDNRHGATVEAPGKTPVEAQKIRERGRRGSLPAVHDEENQGELDHPGDRRRNGGSLHAEGGKPQRTEDEHVVARHVQRDGDRGRVQRQSGVADAAKCMDVAHADRRDEVTQGHDSQVPGPFGNDRRVGGEHREQKLGREHPQRGEHDRPGTACQQGNAHRPSHTGNIASPPVLGGKNRASAPDAEKKEHQQEEDLITKGNGADLHLAELPDHESVGQIQHRHQQMLQGDRHREFHQGRYVGEIAEVSLYVRAGTHRNPRHTGRFHGWEHYPTPRGPCGARG